MVFRSTPHWRAGYPGQTPGAASASPLPRASFPPQKNCKGLSSLRVCIWCFLCAETSTTGNGLRTWARGLRETVHHCEEVTALFMMVEMCGRDWSCLSGSREGGTLVPLASSFSLLIQSSTPTMGRPPTFRMGLPSSLSRCGKVTFACQYSVSLNPVKQTVEINSHKQILNQEALQIFPFYGDAASTDVTLPGAPHSINPSSVTHLCSFI